MAYTSSSAQDRLDAVRSAIDRCLASQEYGVSDRRQRMAELDKLRAIEKELQAEVERSSSPLFSVVQIDRPTTT